MCGRYTQTKDLQQVADRFGFTAPDTELRPRYNVAPGQYAPVVVWDEAADGGAGRRAMRLMRWGLVPGWAGDEKIGNKLINARGETLAEKPSFRNALNKRRCLVIADGFYEWVKIAGGKQPHYIRLEDRRPFAFAGLWERWEKGEGDEPLETFTIVTTEPNATMSRLHHRMPVILPVAAEDTWLRPDTPAEDLLALLIPYTKGALSVHPVDKLVNNPKNDLPDCILPLE